MQRTITKLRSDRDMGRGGGSGKRGGASGGRGGGGSGKRGGAFGGGRGSGGRSRVGNSFGPGKKRGGAQPSANRPRGGGYRPRTGGFYGRPFYRRPWRRRGYYGAPGCGGSGCGFAIIIIFILLGLMVFSPIPNFFLNFNNGFSSNLFSSNVQQSTVEREALPDGSVDETDYYTDNVGWIDNHTVMIDGLRHFYNETGVQPHVYIVDEIDGSKNPSETEIEEYSHDLYDQLFTDEAHLLLIFFEPRANEYMTYYVVGSQARSVIDNEAAAILLDYVNRYYFDDNLTDAEFFSRSFQQTADRIMEVTRSPWITVWILIAIVALIFILFKWWKHKQKQKNEEAKQTEEMLNKPLNTFGSSEADDLAKNYKQNTKED